MIVGNSGLTLLSTTTFAMYTCRSISGYQDFKVGPANVEVENMASLFSANDRPCYHKLHVHVQYMYSLDTLQTFSIILAKSENASMQGGFTIKV